MNKYCYFLLTILVACQPKPEVNNTDSLTPTSGITKEQIVIITEKAQEFPNGTHLSIALIVNGEVNFYGINRKNDSQLMVENHKNAFEIGSITKVFTSTLLANFALDEKIKLDESIDDHLDFKFKNDASFSFKQLANHTSGLPRLPSNLILSSVNPDNPYQAYDEVKLKEYLTHELKLSHKPGEHHAYSNLGVGLLGYVLCTIDSTSFEDLLQQNILSKYQMSNSTSDRQKVNSILIKGLNERGYEVSNWDLSVLVGAGGILSTAEDLSKFAIAQFDDANKELALTRKKTFTINSISDFGLGWDIVKRKSGAIWHRHNGGTGGYTSAMIIDVASKNGIIILSNVSAFSSKSRFIDDLSYDLMKSIN